MNRELYTFLLECGYSNWKSVDAATMLTNVCKEIHQYNRLVGILNEIRLTENPENEQSGNSA